ncbi:SGNH/GDSL hydrolase family protein [Pseudomonas sp. J452]|uniref:SGNH/GDSL hydrolase family protein n=1 Tax=Pseudomonas sp. J452 TaxID=2898441 RepID=UPI0021ADD794|nr:SGNH/GDSL hydrolase family protein [Pseudomonas sp. J452]UUY08600.1 SGNH/GDSL hydrolase family protein [Pseudomonas sp. J452]
MRLRALGWWGLTLALLPVVLPQALWTRRTALRLPPAAGAQSGLVGAAGAAPLRLLLLGESTVAGVGVELQEAALAGQLAQALSVRLQRPVTWRACGENGITAAQACQRLLPQALAEPADLAVLVFGVNDTTHLSSLQAWDDSLRRLSRALAATGCRVVFTGVPPIEHFSALPWLLRKLLGWRAALMDRHLRRVCLEEGVEYQRLALEFAADYLARDGYHPSALGYRVWGEGLALGLSVAPGPAGSATGARA